MRSIVTIYQKVKAAHQWTRFLSLELPVLQYSCLRPASHSAYLCPSQALPHRPFEEFQPAGQVHLKQLWMLE